MLHPFRKFALLAALALSTPQIHAQTSFGRISGTVTDSTGAVVPTAKITVRNTDTQDTRAAETDSNGYYVITNLAIGPYNVDAAVTGFQRQQQIGIAVVADGRATADFKLQIGDVAVTMDVSAHLGEALNVVSGDLSRVIDSKQVDELSLNGNNYVDLITLVPGAVVTNPDQFSVTTSLSATNQTINGNRSDSQNLTVDGAFNLVAGSNGSLMNNVNPNFISEVKVQTSNMSAEWGRAAGVAFNVVTRNGTNRFHGAVFENFRNDKLDARNFFAVTKNQLRYNDFGYDIGGPIKKDKLFFFWGQDWKKLRQTQSPTRVTLPNTQLLSGKFGATNLFYPGTKTPIPDNDISSMITADGRAIANVYRLQEQAAANFTDAAVANNVILQPSNPLDYRQHIIRIDYRLNDKNSIYGRWVSDRNALIDPFGTFSGSNLPTTPTQRNRPGESFLLAHTYLPAPNIINEFRTNASWASQNIPPYGNTWQRDTYGFQFQQLFSSGGTGNYRNGIPDVAISGYANFKGPSFALHSPSTDFQVIDNITWIRGSHVLKGGFAVIRDRVDQNGRPNYTGNVTFSATGNTNTTGNALADALLGNFRTYSESSSDPMGFFRFWQPGAFVQDNWRVNRKLSLEFGLRWELMQPFYTQANNMASFDPTRYDPTKAVTITQSGVLVANSGNYYNGLVRAGDGIPSNENGRVPGSTGNLFQFIPAGAERGFYKTQNSWSPRFGFAYSLDNKTVVRGGYGIFYARPQGNLIFSQLNVPPITLISQLENANLAKPGGGGTVIAPLANISSVDPNLKNGSSQQFSFSIQRELPKSVFSEVSYVGNLGRHLLRQPDINQVPFALNSANTQLPTAQQSATVALRPYKGFNNIGMFLSDSTSNYHSLQSYLSKRMGKVFFTAMYTFSKALGDSSGQGDTSETYRDRHYNYGSLSFDRRHAFVATYVWRLPELKTWNVVARQALGAWQLNGIVRLQSGGYFTITGNTAIGGRRADFAGGDKLLPSPGVNGWINPSAFKVAPVDRLGNTGFASVQGPGLQTYNLAVAKNFRVHEGWNLKFQTDFFNAFNIANFSGLDTNVSNKSFGTLASAYPARQIQMQMKLTF